ncbi:hypothetical protein [Cloacibacterium sp.]|uniref:hypothetical protein n=1 Tax=Cloacibacterium sp. TaxID=1913682 RepID=UPI0035AFE4AA
MKKFLSLFLLNIFSFFFSQEKTIEFSKSSPSKTKENKFILANFPSLKNYKDPLFYINNKRTNLQSFVINEKNVGEINVFRGKKAILKKGMKAKNGLVIIKTKPNITILNLQNFYSEYKISKENKNLPIILNKHFVDEKEYLLLDKSTIISVKILDEQPFVEPVLLPKGKAIYIEAMETK